MSELKPCPFCDHAPTWHFTKKRTSQSGDDLQHYILGCFSPRCTIRPTTTKNVAAWAVAYWEHRADDKQSVDDLTFFTYVNFNFKDIIEKIELRMEKQQ